MNINSMFKKNIFLLIFLGLFVINISFAYGQGDILPAATGNATPGCSAPKGSNVSSKTYCGDYSINDFVSLAINISKWVLRIVGSLTLIMFVYGGFMLLVSAGSAETISKAKKIIIAAIIGLVIVFTSYLIIKFVLASMGLNWNGSIAKPTVSKITSITSVS